MALVTKIFVAICAWIFLKIVLVIFLSLYVPEHSFSDEIIRH